MKRRAVNYMLRSIIGGKSMSRTALVTGGTRGIGEAISLALKEKGFNVAANYGGNDEAAAAFKSKTGILGSAEAGFVDDVIDPSETRKVLINALQMAKKRRNHLGFKRRGITPI